jgi:plastocyanin
LKAGRALQTIRLLRIGLAALLFTLLNCASTPSEEVTVTGRLELVHSGSASSRSNASGVVWLTSISDPVALNVHNSPSKPVLVQKNKSFSPHLLVVPVGSQVVFPNKDPFFHNVFSLFEGKRFDLGLYEAGSSRTVLFDREGISYIFCNIHPEMSAVVVALKTPYYALSDARGAVSIPNVPPGRYELHVWHEFAIPGSLDSQVHVVTVSEDAHSFGTLHIAQQPGAPAPHKNKYGQDYETPSPNDPTYPHP